MNPDAGRGTCNGCAALRYSLGALEERVKALEEKTKVMPPCVECGGRGELAGYVECGRVS